ncbi:DUF3199 family protein [Caloranaerobacter azorensis]|uniref:DUF3199 family protein n=1 Tax=Caloranaerobacter azorensis TaxID=116090 RepID=A0A6P1YDN1_9FIRM|nr:DUF3199 family protein [Caloranaerobacter azorensis]QIB26096.1 DUF3199 family protein [Caloranaerobacter azorensis]
MANRPWITPQDVKDYTEHKAVLNRAETKLKFDIARAERYIIERTNNDFSDDLIYPVIPDEIKMATILVTEFYANMAANNPIEAKKSETFDDYSYTVSDKVYEMSVDDLDISYLINDYIIEAPINKTIVRMRKL